MFYANSVPSYKALNVAQRSRFTSRRSTILILRPSTLKLSPLLSFLARLLVDLNPYTNNMQPLIPDKIIRALALLLLMASLTPIVSCFPCHISNYLFIQCSSRPLRDDPQLLRHSSIPRRPLRLLRQQRMVLVADNEPAHLPYRRVLHDRLTGVSPRSYVLSVPLPCSSRLQ